MKKLNKLIGARVTHIKAYKDKWQSGFLIYFDNGLIITAQDGEYQDNTIRFVSKKEEKELTKEEIKSVNKAVVLFDLDLIQQLI